MALVSPGVEITVVDESNYVPAAAGSVPMLLVATAANKSSGTGSGLAQGTLASAVGNTYLVSSQRELAEVFGNPLFYSDTTGNSLPGYELNEYGLQAAYSVLGVLNRAYVVRADIDLSQLVGTGVRPTGNVDNGTAWLDTANTDWGIFEWNKTTGLFSLVSPTVIISTDDLDSGLPKASIGTVGSYAVVATNTANPVYYKNSNNNWVLVGSEDWKTSWPVVAGSESNPSITAGDTLIINGTTITASGTTVASLASDVNTAAITGITAGVTDNKLQLFADSTASTDGSTTDGGLSIQNGLVGTILADLGITTGTYYTPSVQQSKHTSVPEWKNTDNTPRPTGSVWVKTTTPNTGADFTLRVYDENADSFVLTAAPLYENDRTANKNLDATGGGRNIAAGSYYVQFDTSENDTVTYKLFVRTASGATTVSGTNTSPSFTAGETFTIQASQINSTELTTATTVTLSGTTANDVVADILSANVANVTARITAAGAVEIEHTAGGVLVLKETNGNPLSDAGIADTLTNVRAGNDSDLICSNWIPATYTAGTTRPGTDPADGTYWYYSVADEFDIMIHDGSNWKGYRTVSSDARGYDLTATNSAGPIVSASEPEQQDDETPLVVGDLWINTSDLENFPRIYRYETTADGNEWVQIDVSDSDTENGILFSDARWGTSGDVDPITDEVPSISDLSESNYLDLDAPDADLYPRGTLLWNTRRSGFGVKVFRRRYFNADDFAGTLPSQTSTWVSQLTTQANGAPALGRKSVRQIVVAAMKSAIDTNSDIREEQREFNLIAAPGYPELMSNMVALNNERRNTAFVVGDSPMRLAPDDIENWALNSNNAIVDSEDGLVSADNYLGVFYPSGTTNSLTGQTIQVPPSHMMLRTIARSDNASFPWLAPAGNRRGTIDNANSIGYIDSDTGRFVSIGVTEGIRDTLYQNAINPITFFPGVGLLNYGNKTRVTTPSALDRINVARLINYIRSQLDKIAKAFIFEPNDKLTRDELKGAVEGFFNDLVAKRGVYDYLVVCDESNNTPTRIDRNELYMDIAIEPVKSVEFVYIPIRIKNTGELEAGNTASSSDV